MGPVVNRIFLLFGLVFMLPVLSGCSSHVAYDTLEQHLAQGDCNAASELMAASESDYGENAALLFLLDSAMVDMQCRRFGPAQEKFRAAEDLAEALWTLSLSREAATYLTNEYVQSYAGEDFERAMIHLMSALAFLEQGLPEEALVECRRLDTLLAMFSDKYQGENGYREDAFARYLSGILRQGDRDPGGAFIDYKKALDAYTLGEDNYGIVPEDLKASLFRAAQKAGRPADALAALPGYRAPSGPEDTAAVGQVVWIRLRGRVPPKTEKRITLPSPHGPLIVAFPGYGPRSSPEPEFPLTLRSETGEIVTKPAVLVSNISAVAVAALEDKRGRITAKALARAAAKQVLIQQVTKNKDKEKERVAENILNIINLFIERADLRSWRSLPGQIYMARFYLPAGNWYAEGKKLLVKAGEIRYIVVNDAWGGPSNEPSETRDSIHP